MNVRQLIDKLLTLNPEAVVAIEIYTEELIFDNEGLNEGLLSFDLAQVKVDEDDVVLLSSDTLFSSDTDV